MTRAGGRRVHVVLPNDIDDPAVPSGGNLYDRKVCDGLAALGWTVHEHAVPGGWPSPTAAERAGVGRVLAALPDGALVLLDGLVASTVPEELTAAAVRLRTVVVVHMPLDSVAEGTALAAATAVVTTSEWTRRWLTDRHALPDDRLHVAAPGVQPAPLAAASGDAAARGDGGRLLCVAAVVPRKGHDVLVEALARVAELPFDCVCAGALDRDAGHAGRVRERIASTGLAGRVHLVGPRDPGPLYAGADLLVLASQSETYGMVVTEALARGVPVLATAVGGVPEALGRAPDGSLPGLLVEPDDPAALAFAIRRWLGDPALRRRLRGSAGARRGTLTGWAHTAALVSAVLLAAALPTAPRAAVGAAAGTAGAAAGAPGAAAGTVRA